MRKTNMDLQAILDATDSFSDTSSSSIQQESSFDKGKTLNPNSLMIDLERILREDDNDNDDDDSKDDDDDDDSERKSLTGIDMELRSIGNTTISTKTAHLFQFPETTDPSSSSYVYSRSRVEHPAIPDASCCDTGVVTTHEAQEFYRTTLENLCCATDVNHSSTPRDDVHMSDMPRLEISELIKNDPGCDEVDLNVEPTNLSNLTSPGPYSDQGKGFTPGGHDAMYGAHNPQDWAVLQAILSEVDDDEPQQEEKRPPAEDVSKTDRRRRRNPSNDASSDRIVQDVDAILRSIRDEDDTDEDLGDVSEFDEIVRKITSQKHTRYPSVVSREKRKPSPSSSTSKSKTTRPTVTTSSSQSPIATRSALQHAHQYEKRLLRPGTREIVSPLMVKRKMKPKIELDTKSRQHRIDSSKSPMPSQPKFGFAGVIQSQTMQKISQELLKNAHMRRNAVGLPTALAVNSKFIAIGTQRGIVLVFDLFEEVRQQLGRSINFDDGGGSGGSVTSLDLSYNGETIISGYTSGYIVLWDVIKGTILKSLMDAHPSPITSVRFFGEKDANVVSVDAGGLVNKLCFSKNLLWSTYSVDTECLLDGTAGQILALNILPPYPKAEKDHPGKKLVLIALSSERSSFAVAVEPSVNVLHRWAKPSGGEKKEEEEGLKLDEKSFLPCLAWSWSLISGSSSLDPTLARGWNRTLQLLRASFPPSPTSNETPWPAFGIHDEFTTTAPVVALEWLGVRSLVYLTITNEFTVVDTVMMTLLERLDFSGVKLIYAEFSLSRSADGGGGASSSSSTTFQNSMRASDNRLLILCQEELKSISILNTKQRITSLEEDGEWLEALALALDHYESTIKSLEDRKRDPTGKRDLSKHPEFRGQVTEEEEWIAQLLLRYLKLAVENAPEQEYRGRGKIDLAQSHFQMLAGVCIEFCVVTRRLDLLFGPIFRRFQSAGYTTVFLDVLEPYVLNDKLHYIAPEAMAQFVEHCKATNDVATVERCLLHMDVTIMDFDSILALLRKNGMYSALCFVFANGLNDFVTPLEILLEGILDAAEECDLYAGRRLDGVPQNSFEQYGYKAIVYIQHCFEGLSFPQGKPLQPEERIKTLRPQILKFLMQSKYKPTASVARSKTTSQKQAVVGRRSQPYPYLNILIMVDAKAMLEVLTLALDAADATFVAPEATFVESSEGWGVEVDVDAFEPPKKSSKKYEPNSQRDKDETTDAPDNDTLCPDRQILVNILSSIILPMDETTAVVETTWQYQVAKNAFLDFMANYLLKGVVTAPKSLTFSILSRMSHRATDSKLPAERKAVQNEVIALIKALPTYSYDRAEVLSVVEKAEMSRAALLLHKMAVSTSLKSGTNEDRYTFHFAKAIECYLKDDEKDFRLEVFNYIKKECMEASMAMATLDTASQKQNMHDSFRNALCRKLPDLIGLDAIHSAQLVAEVYVDELDEILNALAAVEDGEIEFRFLHAIISGELTKIDSVAGPVLGANLTLKHHQDYLTLMAKYHPEMVYHYLSTHDNYRPEECLKLCQEYEIADASAYLLERMGNVSSALQLMLQTLEGRMMTLKRIVRGMSSGGGGDSKFSNKYLQKRFGSKKPKARNEFATENARKDKEIEGVKQMLVVALDLCERNSGSSSSEHGSQLWFNVLDRLINAKGFLRLAKELPDDAEIVSNVLSELLQLTMQRMVSNVPLPDLVHKITTDHAGNRLGEFREMIVSMLKTYSFELDVCANAAEVMHLDVRQMSLQRHDLKLRGSRIRTLVGIPLGTNKLSNAKIVSKIPTGSIVTASSSGNADIFLKDPNDATDVSNNKDTAVRNAVSRLQQRRQMQRRSFQGGFLNRGARSPGLSMMTLADRDFARGESSEVANCGPRYIGALSNAEHFGRFG